MSRFYDALKQASKAPSEGGEAKSVNALDLLGLDRSSSSTPDIPLLYPELPDTGISDSLPPDTDKELADAAIIPGSAKAPSGSLRINLDPRARLIANPVDTSVIERYRKLRTKIIQLHSLQPFRSVVVTSPSPQEGKTVTVLNLALSFGVLPSFEVLVVDGDMRRSTLGMTLGIANRPGFGNLIEGSAELDDVLVRCENLPIHIIPSGTAETSPGELLQSPQLKTVLKRLTDRFPLVLMDTPPLELITDAQLLAANCDAVMLVARSFHTTRKSLEKAANDLSGSRVLGAVLNGATRAKRYGRYGNSY